MFRRRGRSGGRRCCRPGSGRRCPPARRGGRRPCPCPRRPTGRRRCRFPACRSGKCVRRPSGARRRPRAGRASHISSRRETVRVAICSASCVALEVRRDDDRALVLVARVDDRVELLEHPVGRLLGADVVDVQEVDRGQAVEQAGVRAAAVVLERRADLGQQARQRVDRHGVAGVERGLGDEHRQRRLAGADVAESHSPRPAARFSSMSRDVAPDRRATVLGLGRVTGARSNETPR